ncbi:MAG: tRNA (adenosine(37)-N6)-threonylcarbamoyltransferase complex ATPase subunit type 1 TsaE [Deltaproteobacteria bacterium]
MTQIFISKSEQGTRNLARHLLKKVPSGVFCLYGDLGAGKTVFCKGLAEAIGIPIKKIKSPTYVLIRPYVITKKKFYHCDFYRIQEPDDILASELEEIFSQKNAVIAIEWPERIEKLLPKKRINIYFEYKDAKTRIICTK